MRRWIAIFFLVLFPLQAVWAAAAPYCQHEKEPTTFHIGHHAHDHHGVSNADGSDHQLPDFDHGDCHACHAFCGALYSDATRTEPITVAPTPAIVPVFALPSPPQTQPERPNWNRFA